MIRRPPRSTRTDTLFPYTTLFRSQEVEDAELTIYWGVGTVRSMGSESDSLLGLLAQEYGSPPSHRTMSARTRVTVAALNSDPRAPHAGKLTMKRSEERRVGKECVST